jgi:2-polyprenyl-6-hydroxyphenyl methylase/3-demethylubiquinone-9 3-methyltransferase
VFYVWDLHCWAYAPWKKCKPMEVNKPRLEQETAQFNAMATDWWDLKGSCRLLHDINPLRTQFIADRCILPNRQVLDVGCGGGILAESLSQRGACVTGIDAADRVIACAKLHAQTQGLNIDYHVSTAETWLNNHPDKAAAFDVVTCLELIEHVDSPKALIKTLSALVKPGGDLFLSTLNRTPKAFLLAIIGVEYVLRWLPRGTHQYKDFIRPSELRVMLQATGFSLQQISGMDYHPWMRQARLTTSIEVNYLVHAKRLI